MISSLYDRKTSNDNLLIKSPKLNGSIVENILLQLNLQKEVSVSELLSESKRKLPLTSYKIIKKHLVHLTDYELISYNGQRHVYQIEENGIDLLSYINNEKKSMIDDIDDLTITIERGV